MNPIVDSAKLDKTAFQISVLGDTSSDRTYSAQKSPGERLAAVEYLRVLNYGEAATSARLQRLLTIIELSAS